MGDPKGYGEEVRGSGGEYEWGIVKRDIQHAAIAKLICVGCIALKDYVNDYFLLFSAIYVDLLCFSFWMYAGLVWTLPN